MTTKTKVSNWQDLPIVLTPHEVGLILNLSDDKVRKMCADGHITSFRVSPRKWGIRKDSLKEQIETGTIFPR